MNIKYEIEYSNSMLRGESSFTPIKITIRFDRYDDEETFNNIKEFIEQQAKEANSRRAEKMAIEYTG